MMMNSRRVNIFELLETEFIVFDSVVDVGCGELYDLINFEFSPFKTLIGIEKEFHSNGFGAYFRLKSEGLNLKPEEMREYRSELFQQFQKRFTIYNIDFQTFPLGVNTHSLIICNKVLHFFNHADKLVIIDKFYNALQPNGLLFLKINHFKHPNNTNLELVNHIGDHIYQSKNNEEDVRYLINPDAFKSMLSNYQLLGKYTKIDEKMLTIIIRK